MLTGDSDKVAQAVAAQLGVDEVHSELLPADKVKQVESLLAQEGEKKNWRLSVTESMTRPCFQEQI